VDFEYDAAKSAANKAKHGIDFEEAKLLWDDPRLLVVPARTEDEPRFLAVGRVGVTHWSAIYTPRDERIRLISVRRSREEEVERYEGE
jgi:uncharacterized protein